MIQNIFLLNSKYLVEVTLQIMKFSKPTHYCIKNVKGKFHHVEVKVHITFSLRKRADRQARTLKYNSRQETLPLLQIFFGRWQ